MQAKNGRVHCYRADDAALLSLRFVRPEQAHCARDGQADPHSFFGMGGLDGLAPTLVSESFPTKVRYSGTGIAYNISAIPGGMIPPSLLAGLIGQNVFQRWYFVPLLCAFYCVVAMLALLFLGKPAM